MSPPQRQSRIEAIDGARGTAMLLVFLAHFVEVFYASSPEKMQALRLVTRIASPAFLWISGMTLATLYARGTRWAERTRDRVIDRALFLLLICHPLIAGAHLVRASTWRNGLRVMFITDTIGFCLLLGVVLIPRLGTLRRLALGAVMMLAGWVGTLFWSPALGGLAWRLKDTLVGDLRDHWMNYLFPLVPWIGLYLVGSAFGDWFVRSYDAGRLRRIQWSAVLLGAGCVLAGVAVEVGLQAAARLPWFHAFASPLALLARAEKVPPTPVYFLRYGGLALILFGGVLAAQRASAGRSLTRWVALFGRCSVVAFVIQYYVYYVLVGLLPRPPERWAPLYFAGTVALLQGLVWAWERMEGNRLITVGYPTIVKKLRLRGGDPTQGELAFGMVRGYDDERT